MSTTTMSDAKQSIDFYRGVKLLHDPVRNKGTAFSAEERDALGLRGLLPPVVVDQQVQVSRIMNRLRQMPSDLERYVLLTTLQDRNERLFYRVLIDHLEELVPIVYTPTVGKACQEFGHIFRRPRGMYISAHDRTRIDEVLGNWPHEDVRVIVVTDGGRILGLGDLGADGMGIPIGKLALYTTCAGISPTQCLPITLDVGTENEELLNDPHYIGLKQRRLKGREYDEFLEEFIGAVQKRFPKAVIQLEDFATSNAFGLLKTYRDRACVFDDDIQGTAGVVLTGFYSALRITGGKLGDGRYLFMGAGEAGAGIAELLVRAMTEEGMPESDARRRCWLVDSKGLVVAGRKDLAAHKVPFAHEHEPVVDLLDAVKSIKPTALIGVCGQPAVFTRAVLEEMARIDDRPLIFALSNPTSKSECTAVEAYEGTGGRGIFASGSPFDTVEYRGQRFEPGQGNNAYIFPGVGLGLVVSGATRATDEMFMVAAKALAVEVSESDLEVGRLYPPLSKIRQLSVAIAAAVAEVAFARGLATVQRPDDLPGAIREYMFEPDYASYV